MSEFSFFSSLPQHEINAACSGMSSDHAAYSQLVKEEQGQDDETKPATW